MKILKKDFSQQAQEHPSIDSCKSSKLKHNQLQILILS
jgi:hypothetical protein